MLAIILSAGKSSRFSQHGFHRQKSMLPMPDGNTMLSWQLETLGHVLQEGDSLLYLSRKEYEKDEDNNVQDAFGRARVLHGVRTHAYYTDHKTKGALDAIYHCRELIETISEKSTDGNGMCSVLVLYNDELVSPDSLHAMVEWSWFSKIDACVASFDSDDPRYTRIPNESGLACGCTYWFRDCRTMLLAAAANPRNEENGLPDAVYSHEDWSNFYLNPEDYIELGTADEYKAWMESLGYNVGWYKNE